MSSESFQIFYDFFTTKPAPREALKSLKRGHEIRIKLPDGTECVLLYNKGTVLVENRPSPLADVEFEVDYESLRVLSQHEGDKVSELGIDIMKEIMLGRVKVKICGPFHRLLTGGYLKVLSSGGPEFFNFLNEKGIQGLGKVSDILNMVKKFKKD